MRIEVEKRQRWMAVLARARCDELERAWDNLAIQPQFDWLRRPETGLVLVRARAGGTGALFNLGEVTMTRCAVRLADGMTGFAFVLGRDQRHAQLAAVFDALLQGTDDSASGVLRFVTEFGIAQSARREIKSRKAASTKVHFFAMARGMSPE
ncbi:phosphonate C-P lyase system protein PhnG [Mesorhizobium sp. SEMIA 3007]|uniref:phosphonate C-P lyase system protein PhnG n=1 Tax=Mesorhizobium sp. SEMIA 3007 TaxID=1862350 RepID=UPI00083E2C4D|nr:phosphonate C-P lyase system protein PhnG [Mesorhizobium sp. SEMIA 3007]ODA93153.1 phosphonate C-P lyase system protein PhnG [Mesorhizobium sp. SEMIA 3007]